MLNAIKHIISKFFSTPAPEVEKEIETSIAPAVCGCNKPSTSYAKRKPYNYKYAFHTIAPIGDVPYMDYRSDDKKAVANFRAAAKAFARYHGVKASVKKVRGVPNTYRFRMSKGES